MSMLKVWSPAIIVLFFFDKKDLLGKMFKPSSSSWGHSLKPYVAYFIPVLSVLSHLITTQQHPRCWNVSQRYIGFIRCGRPMRNLYAEFSSQNLGESGASSGMGFSIQKFLTKAFLTHRISIPCDSSYLLSC